MQPYILYESHNALGHNGSTRLYHFIRMHYYCKKLHQHCNKYVCSCTESQQVTLKEPQYINLHLSIPQFPMLFMYGLVRSLSRNWKGKPVSFNCHIHVTHYVFMIPIRSKSTEKVIKVHLTGIYSTFRGSKYILTGRGQWIY